MKYRVWSDDYDLGPEDGRVIEAPAGYAAAEAWAKHRDQWSAEYSIAHGGTAVVHVRPDAGGETCSYEVTGEAVPHYTARPVRPNAPNQHNRVRHG